MGRITAPLAAIAAALLAACNGEATATRAQEGPRFVPGQEPAGGVDNGQRDVAELAIDALAAHLGIAAEGILVDTIRPVEWRDSSLGCPQPGEAYLQVITPGNKVSLRADGQIYVVHQAGNRAFVCVQRKDVGGLTTQRELVMADQILAARRDLAGRLGVPEDQIRPASAEKKTWQDASLGCAEPGVDYAEGPVTGWVLTLRHAGRVHTYHTDMQRTIPCPPIAED